ncbi:MAG: thioredoxin domain-containing protein [archaeon]|nr:thioredoxin domain-containing protein [archaeon]
MWVIIYFNIFSHCKHLAPEYERAATQLKGQIKLAKVDATANAQLSQRFRIQGYPTLKIFKPGKENKSDAKAEDYQGPRETAGIVSYALEKLDQYGYAPTAQQLINNDILKETCMDKNGICIISFLPHIADSNANERNKYIEQIQTASKNSRGKPIYFLWAQGGDFFNLEDQLHLSFGYPAVIALNYSKKKYAVCRRAFSAENLKDFIVNIFLGKEPLSNLPELKKLKPVEKWNGKDYVPEKQPSDDL